MAVPKRKMSRSATRSRKSANMRLVPTARTRCARTAARRSSRTRCAATAAGTGAGRCSTSSRPMGAATATGRERAVTPVIALDAMGGDRAPAEIVAGGAARRGRARRRRPARRARPTRSPRTCPAASRPAGVEVLAGVRSDRDGRRARERRSAPRRTRRSCACAEAVRDGRAARDGRRRQHRRHDGRRAARAWAASAACTAPRSRCRSRCSGADRSQLLVDGGATVDPEPEWLVSGRVLGREYARVRLGVDEPTVALLSNGEEPGKGDALRKAACAAARRGEGLRSATSRAATSARRRPT